MSLRLAFDVDGVLADFATAFREVAHKIAQSAPDEDLDTSPTGLERRSNRALKRAWKVVTRTSNWWTKLKPHEPGQLRRLYELARGHQWEVFFLTTRPQTTGDSVQFQTQWWLEEQGFYLPAVVTVPGSRGELASVLRLDLIVDDTLLNCIEVVSASPTKGLLLLRDTAQLDVRDQATTQGIGVVDTLEHAIDVAERLQDLRTGRASKSWTAELAALIPWLRRDEPAPLPFNPREEHPPPHKKR